jgi:hypothetical protein
VFFVGTLVSGFALRPLILDLILMSLVIVMIPGLSSRLDKAGISQLTLRGRRHYQWQDVTSVQQKYSILYFRFSVGSARVPLRVFRTPDAAVQYVAAHLPKQTSIT